MAQNILQALSWQCPTLTATLGEVHPMMWIIKQCAQNWAKNNQRGNRQPCFTSEGLYTEVGILIAAFINMDSKLVDHCGPFQPRPLYDSVTDDGPTSSQNISMNQAPCEPCWCNRLPEVEPLGPIRCSGKPIKWNFLRYLFFYPEWTHREKNLAQQAQAKKESKMYRRMRITEVKSQTSYFTLLKVSGLRAGLNLGPKGSGCCTLCPFSMQAALEVL